MLASSSVFSRWLDRKQSREISENNKHTSIFFSCLVSLGVPSACRQSALARRGRRSKSGRPQSPFTAWWTGTLSPFSVRMAGATVSTRTPPNPMAHACPQRPCICYPAVCCKLCANPNSDSEPEYHSLSITSVSHISSLRTLSHPKPPQLSTLVSLAGILTTMQALFEILTDISLGTFSFHYIRCRHFIPDAAVQITHSFLQHYPRQVCCNRLLWVYILHTLDTPLCPLQNSHFWK